MSLIRWNPARVLDLRQEFDRLFDDLWQKPEGDAWLSTTWYPAVDWTETDDAFEVSAELPGMKREDIAVNVQRDSLTIQGEKKSEHEAKEGGFHRTERSFGRFSRSFSCLAAVEADRVEATYKDGVLKLKLPKAVAARPRQIEVKAS